MGVPYSWFLSPTFTKDRVLELVRTIPNAGLTEPFDGAWVDVYRKEDGQVISESADVEAFVRELEKGRGGTLSYDVASTLELARCIAVEIPPTSRPPGRETTFDGYRCVDLAKTLARAEGLLDDGFDDGHDGVMLGDLCGSLSRALELHIAVVFGE
jgi:hypothetical protein